MQRVFLVHGWGGSPNNDWFAWAKKHLQEKGFEVFAPEMPDTEHPKISPWVGKLAETVGEVRKDDIFVGHSIAVKRSRGICRLCRKVQKLTASF